jgi:outer membrane protein assembly factor BamB
MLYWARALTLLAQYKIKLRKRKMQKLKNKTMTIMIALILMISMTISTVALPTAKGAGTKMTYAFIGATPNPNGVGQQTLFRFGITDQTASTLYSWTGITVTVTSPDGTNATLGPFKTDSTGGSWCYYTPTMVGNYTLQSHFPEQTNPNSGNGIPLNTVMLASDSPVVTFVVQQEPIPSYPNVPLPTDYWTRPINDQFNSWAAIGGNWLTASNLAPTYNRIAIGNDNAPTSPHVLWSHSLNQAAGLVGGSLSPWSNITLDRMSAGDAYEGKFLGSVIMLGNLYYRDSSSVSTTCEYTCINLHTGETLWTQTLLNNLTLSRGQIFNWNSIDLFGSYAYLWATANAGTRPLLGLPSTAGTIWCAFDPITGNYMYTLYGLPSGSTVYGPNGEILIYTLNQANGWMTLWNSTNIPALYASTDIGSMGWGQWEPQGKIVNATGLTGTTTNMQPSSSYLTPLGLNGYMSNVTIPKGLPGSVISVLDDRIMGGTYSTTAVNLWAVSRAPETLGQLLYNATWTPPAAWAAGNVTVGWCATSDYAQNGVLILGEKETVQDYAFSTETGQYLWVTKPESTYLDYLLIGMGATGSRMIDSIYDGRFYQGSYAGVLYCYNITNGDLLWTYTASNPYAEGATWGQWPLYPMFIANGMFYFTSTEHSGYEQSLPPGAPMICLNATTGALIWREDGLFRGTHWGGYPIIGDSIIVSMNGYDQQIYAIGKGPSAITVQAPMTGVTVGDSLVIRGTVTDVSPGTQQDALKLRFPNGVPAVSDANMSDWMGYVYEQFPTPTNVNGVQVTIDVIDANGNYRNIGTTTSDSSGMFTFAWTPDITGSYTVIATFAGSQSYYGSSAESSFVASAAAPTASPYPVAANPLPSTEMYIAVAAAAIIVAIAIVGALILMAVKKRP